MGEDGIDDLPLPFEGDYEGNLWAGSEMALLILFQHFQTVIFATASEPLPTTRRWKRQSILRGRRDFGRQYFLPEAVILKFAS